MHFQNVFVALLRGVAKNVTSSLLSWHERYDINAANCQLKCALQTQWIRMNMWQYMYEIGYGLIAKAKFCKQLL